MLSLVLDGHGGEGVDSEQIWRIYYDLYLGDEDMALLAKQAEKLLGVSGSLGEWNDSVYGATLRFCDQYTFGLVRDVWRQLVASAKAKQDPGYKARFESNRKASQEYKDEVWGKANFSYTSARAGAPLFSTMFGKLGQATEGYWRTGRSDPRPSAGEIFPNPMFAVAMSSSRPLAFADPTLSFHLAPAHAKLTELSPLRLENQTEELGVFKTAQLLFKEWTSSFKQAASRMVVRFAVADCYSLCQTLQHNAETGETCANWYQRESSFQVLKLENAEYGKDGKAPRKFDVIDTSNISDYNGALHLLVSAGPLLKDRPWSAVYTELMARDESIGNKTKFETLLCGHTTTVALLLGLAPIEYWTNAKAVSVSDEVMAAMLDWSSRGGVKVQARLAWKLDRYLTGRELPALRLSLTAKDVADHAYQVYLTMFEDENLQTFLSSPAKRYPFPKSHRGSFAAFVKAVCKSVRTNAEEVGRLLAFRINDDLTLALSSNHLQAFCLELSHSKIYTDPSIENDTPRRNSLVSFCRWKEVPLAVAITLVIPRARWQKLHRLAHGQWTPLVFEGSVRCTGGNNGGYRNLFADVQVSFGTLTTKGSRESDNFALVVEEDQKGWAGDSPMIASFSVSAAVLQFDIPTTSVALDIGASSPQFIAQLREALDERMAIFRTPIVDEEHVYISKFRPEQTGHPVLGGALSPVLSLGDLKIGSGSEGTEAAFTVDIDGKSGDVKTITGHVDISTEKGKKLLADKVPIELQQSSPFTIDIVFGKRALVLPLTFSVPVNKESAKTRIARKSCYVEVIAQVASPLASPALEDYIFPTVLSQPSSLPTTLNIPHLSLDTLPILAIDDKERIRFLTPFSTFMFSTRELRLRQQAQAETENGLSTSPRLNFKESLFTMMMLTSGLQGGQSGLFAIARPSDGIHMLIAVSAMRLDGVGAGVVLDAAAIPFTREIIEGHKMDDFLLILRTLEIVNVTVDDAELQLWKKVLPAFAERCRTWTHDLSTCEYKKLGKIPVSLEDGKQVLCSCGRGKFPEGFLTLPEWDQASTFATRVAISLAFASPFVEDVVHPDLTKVMDGAGVGGSGSASASAAGLGAAKEACRACGRADAKPNGGPLKKCARCLAVKYCSAECQKKDWKKHRMECVEMDVFGDS